MLQKHLFEFNIVNEVPVWKIVDFVKWLIISISGIID